MKKYYILALIVMLFSVYMGCKKDKEDENPTPPTYTNGVGEIGAIGGTITIDDVSSPLNGATIIIPEGALSGIQTIEIIEAPSNIIFPGDSALQIVQFLPSGLTFQKPITIELPYTRTDTSRLGLFYYNPDDDLISEMPKTNIDPIKKTISGLTDHFSYYIAWDRTVGITFNMIKTSNNTIGVRLDVYGYGNNEYGFKYIPTTLLHSLQTGEFNAWLPLSNSEYSNLYSLFRVDLYEDRLIGKNYVASAGIDISRVQTYYGGAFAADIYKRNESELLYGSGDLETQDIGGDYNNLGRWFSGEPLLFLFDGFTPDPDKKYFVKARWSLASERDGETLFNYTPIFKFHNKPDKQKISEMPFVNISQIDDDGNFIQDVFQVWNTNEKPDSDFEADQTNAEPGQIIQFTDLSTNDPTAWDWDFGDGSTSNQKNPTHSYSTQGNYTVSLEASNQYGSNVKTIENYILVSSGLFIEVITPNGNNEWIKGLSYEITWNDNISENVIIKLLKNNDAVLTIVNTTTSNGSFTWTIPTSLEVSSSYKVQISSINNSSIVDVSDNEFSILEVGNIQVTNPNSSTTWEMGQYNVPIKWETGNLGGAVTVQIYKGENKLGTITPDAPNTGSYNEYDVQTTLSEGNDYRIKIVSNDNANKFDLSDYFTITESSNLPPEPPKDEYPIDQSTMSTLSETLFWTCEDPENDSLEYDIYFGVSTDPPLIVGGISANTYPTGQLTGGTRYYWKVVAKDNHGNSTSSPVWWFETVNEEPPVADFAADITTGDAPLSVNFTDLSSNNPSSWLWDFGDGEVSTVHHPTHIFNNGGSYTISLTVTNETGSDEEIKEDYIIAEGGEPCPGTPTVTDADGNVYNTVQIGGQCWMKENLRVGTRIDGSQEMTSNSMIEKYCYDDDPANCEAYGGLYQWNEMMQYTTTPGIQGICPSGWHLPTDDEWKTMEMALGMSQSDADGLDYRGTDEGEKMKSTSDWINNGNGTNSSGFTALPGGIRHSGGDFGGLGSNGYWWSSSERSGSIRSWYRLLNYDYDQVYRHKDHVKVRGLSVRCLKN